MIYKTIKDLPKELDVLPLLAKRMWLRVFNRVYKTKTEPVANKSAWEVVALFYRENKVGKWQKRRDNQ